MTKYSEKLVGKKIAVIGGSSGIGYGAAEILADAGASVIIISSNQDRVTAAAARLGNNVKGLVGDVRDEAAFTEVLKSLAPLDHVVFSGVDKIIRGDLVDADFEEARELFGVKFWGSFVVAKALAKHDIVKPGGSLTLTSGTAALRPKKGTAVGSALNAGVIAATAGLAHELTDKKIRVNTVVPGLVKTELWDKLGISGDKKQKMIDEGAKALPVGFVAGPEEVAEAYLYLVRADYANGTTVVIDGGGAI
ncbi:hypothetical protein QBC47DRAFT_326689 [Echria macrotheca]|uniref:Uncharacterized protein n=1 Tax=Echria macrotheca TaxID=438768 RepID=A0AAJ0F304_9PEZI|nr:hypothetical protein QBC47DRAFT_326689 [Echria macrotheca]